MLVTEVTEILEWKTEEEIKRVSQKAKKSIFLFCLEEVERSGWRWRERMRAGFIVNFGFPKFMFCCLWELRKKQ